MFTKNNFLRFALAALWLFSAAPAAAISPQAGLQASTYTVNLNTDEIDASLVDGVCDINTGTPGNQCTLRAAIQQSNFTGGANTIQFSSAMTISPAAPLPVIFNTLGSVTISGDLQVTLDGSNLTPGNTSIGIKLNGSFSEVQGLIIQDFSYGVMITGTYNTVGVDDSDMSDNGEMCVIISNDENASAVLPEAGIYITGNYNTVAGNVIGLSLADTAAPNENGILIEGDHNTIGTDGDGKIDADEGNWISGNATYGVWIKGGTSSPKPTANVIAGNIIGLNAAGSAARPNGEDGIQLYYTGVDNIIGTNGDGAGDAVERNIISGNGNHGVYISQSSNFTRVAGNYIGTNLAGSLALPNAYDGVNAYASTDGIIGTNGDGVSDNLEGNLISGNGSSGIFINYSDNYWVAGNWIGFKINAMDALPNSRGIHLNATSNNLIGSNADGVSDDLERNVISGNTHEGIYLDNSTESGNQIAGNYIGTRPTGDMALPNGESGVEVYHVTAENTIGGELAAERNVISGNTQNGIFLDASSTILVRNNWIGKGTDSNDAPLGNQGTGVLITGGVGVSNNNTVIENVIAHNNGDGIQVGLSDEDLSSGNRLENNSIYDNDLMGIDLSDQGNEIIDAFDADSGPNGLQNFPEILTVAYNGPVLEINTTLHSTQNANFVVWFYRSPTCDASGYGEGRTLVGTMSVSTASSGETGVFVTHFGWPPIQQNDYITALAINTATGNTSEFSACLRFTAIPPAIHPIFLPAILR
ncbi:MAG TPA: right-handed parallel beta-helix repeat-containing protein [Anaerolineaceae bacterium]|nr:right-handed parallel beta-helix repeat-containing protein [Anaerolineaceae bacterium]